MLKVVAIIILSLWILFGLVCIGLGVYGLVKGSFAKVDHFKNADRESIIEFDCEPAETNHK